MEKKEFKKLHDIEVKKYFKGQKPPKLKNSEHFIDPDFPPEYKSILCENPKISEKQMEHIKSEIRLDEIEWKRIKNLSSGGSLKIFEDIIDFHDIKQGGLSDCYWLSSLAALTEFPDYIFHKFRTTNYNEEGVYEVLLYIEGEWQIVLLDDYFPFTKGTNNLAFTQTNGDELWVILLEKAWAKVNGSYSNIVLGLVSDALQALTGFGVEYYPNTSLLTPRELWEKVKKSDTIDCVMCAGTKDEQAVESHGLVRGHAYSLVSANETLLNGTPLQLLKLYNPWGGKREWNGSWSDDSPLWTEELIKTFNKENADDGMFFMDINDFPNWYEALFICNIMYGASVRTYHIEEHFINKPVVFKLTIPESTDVCLSVFFKQWRFDRKPENDIDRPFSLVYAKFDATYTEVETIDGCFTMRDDIHIYKRFVPGNYMIWMFSTNPETEKYSYKFRISSGVMFHSFFAGVDTSFELISYMIASFIKNKEQLSKKVVKDLYAVPNSILKQAGIYTNNCWGNKSLKPQKVVLTLTNHYNYSFLNSNPEAPTREITLNPGEYYVLPFAQQVTKVENVSVGFKKVGMKAPERQGLLFPQVKEILSKEEPDYKFIQVEYQFPNVEDLKIQQKFAKRGEMPKVDYVREDLLKEDEFIAQEVFKLLEKEKRSPDNKLTIVYESTGKYMGEKQITGQRYFGARIFQVSGDYYFGGFRDKLFDGKGRYFSKNRLQHVGKYRDGKKHGKGVLFTEDRDIYRGKFRYDQRIGLFRIYHENTNSLSIVFMDGDEKEGYGIEVNYPQRNTKITYFKNNNLINFLVVDYEFFREVYNENEFNRNHKEFAIKFKNAVEAVLPMKDTNFLLYKRICQQRKRNEEKIRSKDPFMYDMLGDFTYQYITGINYHDIEDKDLVSKGFKYQMITNEETDECYKVMYNNKVPLWIFFLNITKNKPKYDKTVRWIFYTQDEITGEHIMLYKGGFAQMHSVFYDPFGGYMLWLAQNSNKEEEKDTRKDKDVVKSKGMESNPMAHEDKKKDKGEEKLPENVGLYYFPERAVGYGEFNLDGKSSGYKTFTVSGFYNNFIHSRDVYEDIEYLEDEDRDDEDDDQNDEDVDEVEKEKDEGKNVTVETKKKTPVLPLEQCDFDRKFNYFIPKYLPLQHHLKAKDNPLIRDPNNIVTAETMIHIKDMINKYYKFLYIMPYEGEQEYDILPYFQIDDLDSIILGFEFDGRAISFVTHKYEKDLKKRSIYISACFEKSYGIIVEGDVEYIGTICEGKKVGNGLERKQVEDEELGFRHKTIHLVSNETEKIDCCNLEFYTNTKECEAYYYNDGIKCSENLDLVIYVGEDYIGKSAEKVEEIRKAINNEIRETLYRKHEKKYKVLLDLLFDLPESKFPHVMWYEKHTLNGYYIGEVDVFYQATGRGILIYGNHCSDRGAYVGYFEANMRHGKGFHIHFGIEVNIEYKEEFDGTTKWYPNPNQWNDRNKRKDYYFSQWNLDEQILIDEPLSENQLKILQGFKEKKRRYHYDEFENHERLQEYDLGDEEGEEPRLIQNSLASLQWFVNNDADLFGPFHINAGQTQTYHEFVKSIFAASI